MVLRWPAVLRANSQSRITVNFGAGMVGGQGLKAQPVVTQ